MLMMLPFYHIYGFGFLTYALLNGATGVIMKQFNPEVYCGSIQKYKVGFGFSRARDFCWNRMKNIGLDPTSTARTAYLGLPR